MYVRQSTIYSWKALGLDFDDHIPISYSPTFIKYLRVRIIPIKESVI